MNFDQYLCLLRQTAEAEHATETPDIDVDTAAMFTKSAPWVPLDNDITSSRKYVIEAHRQYLKLVHHIPLATDPSNFENAVKSIHTLVRIADAYDSLTVVSMPVENFLIRNYSLDLKRFSNAMNAELCDIAMKIRSRWLLKEIGCRIIADPGWDDHDIEHNLYSSGAGELLLSKRAELRDMLRDVEKRIIRIQPPKTTGRMPDEEHTVAFATKAFRNEIRKFFKSHRNGEWISYARKFRLLKEQLLCNTDRKWQHCHLYDDPLIDRLYDKFGKRANLKRGNFAAAFHSLQNRTAEIIKPLFDCVVKQPRAKLNKMEASFQGFLCIDLTDDDIPWKEKCSSIPTGERDGEA